MRFGCKKLLKLVKDYEQELRGSTTRKGLAPTLEYFEKRFNTELCHIYIFGRCVKTQSGGITFVAFYQLPFSDSTSPRSQLTDVVSLVLGKNQNSAHNAEEVQKCNELLSKEPYLLSFNNFKIFFELFDQRNLNIYMCLNTGFLKTFNEELKSVLSNTRPSDYSEQLFTFEKGLYAKRKIILATNLFHASGWIATLLILEREDNEKRRDKNARQRLIRELQAILFVLRPFLAEKMYHLIHEGRFLAQPLADAKMWALGELHHLACGHGATSYNLNFDNRQVGFSPHSSPYSHSCAAQPVGWKEEITLGRERWTISLIPGTQQASKDFFATGVAHLRKTLALVAQTREALLRSARAAIMARNMSHNIGSHALARIGAGVLGEKSEDAERLLQYLQERMDFVARVATQWPGWVLPIPFYAGLLRGFLKQGLLLDNLVADEGYPAAQIQFAVEGPSGNNSWKYQEGNSQKTHEGNSQSEHAEYSEFQLQGSESQPADFLVGIPGGRVGAHAFYGFLENAIRNAAKHNQQQDSLKVALKIENDGQKPVYLVRYQDNLSEVKNGEPLGTVKKHLEQELITDEGTLVAEGWGIQEMKVYAEFLAGVQNDSGVAGANSMLEASQENPFEPLRGKSQSQQDPGPGSSQSQLLTYTFKLRRPCLALVPKSLAKNEADARLHGIESYDEGDGEKRVDWEKEIKEKVIRFSPGLLYFQEPKGNNAEKLLGWFKQNRHWLPARILIRPRKDGNDGVERLREQLVKKGLAHRVRVDPECSNFPENSDQLAIELYRRWLLAFLEERGYAKPVNVVIYFDRDTQTFASRWADLKETAGIYRLEDFVKVYPVYRIQGDGSVNLTPWTPVALPNNGSLEANGLQGTWIVFENHGRGIPEGINALAFRQHVGSLPGFQNNREAFELLADVPQDFTGAYFLVQLVESALLKVLVLDERVAGTVLEVNEKGSLAFRENTNRDMWYQGWYSSGIRLAPVFHWNHGHMCHLRGSVPADKFTGPSQVESEGQYKQLGLHFIWENKKAKLTRCGQINDKAVPETIFPSDGQSSSSEGQTSGEGEGKEPPYDAVVIHRGLLEGLASQVASGEREQFEAAFLEALHCLGARVIVTSGRGALTAGAVARYPFVEYSVLEACIVRELCKPVLGSVLMAVTGQVGDTRGD
jgi:hypothetical protein